MPIDPYGTQHVLTKPDTRVSRQRIETLIRAQVAPLFYSRHDIQHLPQHPRKRSMGDYECFNLPFIPFL